MIPRTPTGDLYNAEHSEASQQAMTDRKAAQRAQMPSEERSRLDTIEDAVRQLEQARIPFLLFADSTPFEDSLKRGCFWQFNKIGYEENWDDMVRNAQGRMQHLLETQLKTLSRMAHGTFVWYTPDDKAAIIARGAEIIRRPVESSADGVPPTEEQP